MISPYLNCIPQSSSQEEESSCVLKPLFAEEGESVFQGRLAPPVLLKVVREELCHSVVSPGSEQCPHQRLLLHGEVENRCVHRILICRVRCFRNLQVEKLNNNYSDLFKNCIETNQVIDIFYRVSFLYYQIVYNARKL